MSTSISDSGRYDLGRHEAAIEAIERRVEHIEEKLDEMLVILHQAQGGWKMFVAIATVSGTLGAILAKFLPIK